MVIVKNDAQLFMTLCIVDLYYAERTELERVMNFL